MSPDIAKLLEDILNSITIIEEHLKGCNDLSSYKGDIKTIDAVERRLAIIGEALWKSDKQDDSLNISNKKRIISLRHILVHDYDLMEDDAIWIICNKYLPVLKIEVQRIVNE